jgi:GDPmannose 4,6-dehydratase
MGRYYREKFGLKIYVGYFFNHDSELRTEKHVNRKITATIARIAKGSSEKLEIGDMDVKKEFNFAGDMMDAVWILINQNSVFETVIGSGITFSIRDWVEYCFSKVGLDWRQNTVCLKGFKSEYGVLLSEPLLIKSLGWKPKTNFYALADKMMEAENYG